VIRRLRIAWPDPRPFRRLGGRPVRILAVSDEPERTLDDDRSRAALGDLDLVVGCGDLEPSYLRFVADPVAAPFVYVRGNHDRGEGWDRGSPQLPEPLVQTDFAEGAFRVLGLSWPGGHGGRAIRDERAAWTQALRAALRGRGRAGGLIVASHVPPLALGDDPADPYHTGFSGYRWLLRRLRPPLWLHGHTPTPPGRAPVVREGGTTLINVTGAVLLELHPAGGGIGDADEHDRSNEGIVARR
jgi:uncharacterized protein